MLYVGLTPNKLMTVGLAKSEEANLTIVSLSGLDF